MTRYVVGVVAAGLMAWGCGAASSAPEPMPHPLPAPSAAPPARSGASRITELPSGVRQIEVLDAPGYWRRGGFVALAPTVRISQPAGGSSVVVYFRAQRGIEAAQVEGRRTLLMPPHSEADRVTYFRAGGGRRTVADVRGGRIDEQGRNWFHVYRPVSGALHAQLIGYEWLVDDSEQARHAKALLMDLVRRTPRALRTAPPTEDYALRFSRLNDCRGCHFADKAPARDPDQWLPLWPTDRAGWYVPLAVLLPSAALSTNSSFHDPNHDDRFVTKHCTTGEPETKSDDDARWFRCNDGSVPYGVRRVSRDDPYARKLCQTRTYLRDRMTPHARQSFADAFAECEFK